MTGSAGAALAADRAQLRVDLATRGFADDGDILRGPVRWHMPGGCTATATIDITVGARYPFGPPAVHLVDTGADVDITFHVDPDGALCLWDTSEPVRDAPWTDADRLLARVASWLETTAAGWPGDDDCDLERYLPGPRAAGMVLYDHDAVREIAGCVRTSTEKANITTVLPQSKRPPSPQRTKTGRKSRRGKTSRPRSARHLAYVADLGPVARPLRNWGDVAAALGDQAGEVRRYIDQGAVELLLLWYQRGSREAALALAVTPGYRGAEPAIQAREVADTSQTSRTVRAGPRAAELAARRVAVVGCGAVGSSVADLLFREGTRKLTLKDGQLFRPGNVVRHAAPAHLVGIPKPQAVKAVLHAQGLDVSGVEAFDTQSAVFFCSWRCTRASCSSNF